MYTMIAILILNHEADDHGVHNGLDRFLASFLGLACRVRVKRPSNFFSHTPTCPPPILRTCITGGPSPDSTNTPDLGPPAFFFSPFLSPNLNLHAASPHSRIHSHRDTQSAGPDQSHKTSTFSKV